MLCQWLVLVAAFFTCVIWSCSEGAIANIYNKSWPTTKGGKSSIPLEALDALQNALNCKSFNPDKIPNVVSQNNAEPQNDNDLFRPLPAEMALEIQDATRDLLLQLRNLQATLSTEIFRSKVLFPSMVLIQHCRDKLIQIFEIQQTTAIVFRSIHNEAFQIFHRLSRTNCWSIIDQFGEAQREFSLRENLIQRDFQVYQSKLRQYLDKVLDAVRNFV